MYANYLVKYSFKSGASDTSRTATKSLKNNFQQGFSKEFIKCYFLELDHKQTFWQYACLVILGHFSLCIHYLKFSTGTKERRNKQNTFLQIHLA